MKQRFLVYYSWNRRRHSAIDRGVAVADGIKDSKRMIMEGVGHEIPEELLPEIVSKIVENIKRAS